jgi:ribonuclease E
MSKELVIAAGSHERRVAIMEEGQLVEIYIEREKEFALVGSIYKGKVTRVLPGMQSAFVEIGLDGDAFLYVSDVFENLEDYDHGHSHDAPVGAMGAAQSVAPAASTIELLPGETLHAAHGEHEEISLPLHDEEHLHDVAPIEHLAAEHLADTENLPEHLSEDLPHSAEGHLDHQVGYLPASEEASSAAHGDIHDESADERQPDSNASAPQNFSPHYNPTQNYPSRGGNAQNFAGGGGQNFVRGNDRGRGGQNAGGSDRGADRGSDRGGSDRGGDRGGDRGRGGRWGRRGGRRRGASGGPGNGPRNAPPQNAGPGRNLPPSKYASPQGDARGESRGYEPGNFEPKGRNDQSRGDQSRGGGFRGGSRGFEPRGGGEPRRESTRFSSPSAPHDPAEEPILLPGESLAKYRGKPAAAAPPVERAARDEQPEVADIEDLLPNRALNAAPSVLPPAPSAAPGAPGTPRRFTGGLPRWLLAEEGADAAPAIEENLTVDDASAAQAEESVAQESSVSAASETVEAEISVRGEVDLNEDQVASLASELVEAKHEETQEHAKADAIVGGAEFDDEEEDQDEEDEESADQHLHEHEEEEDDEEEELQVAEDAVQTSTASERSEAEADAAHEDAHAEAEEVAALHAEASGAEPGEPAAIAEEESILLPGETRAPRAAGAPREDFPRDSARVAGGNPRSRFQRPFRGGGRDRGPRRDGRDSRGGPRHDNRGHDNRGGENRSTDSRSGSSRPPDSRPFENRGSGEGRPRFDRGRSGGQRFERRPGGGGHHRGHGHHSGPSRRPQLISEMLKAGQDVVVQIAKEPLGKKGARITSHVALPGRFLVYMPTIDHIGVSRKIESAENRSRLRRLVGGARGSYPGGFIVRTAAGGATDEEIQTDIDFLGKTWNEIKQKSEERKAPALLHRDLNLVERILRDYVSDDFTAIWIDNEEEYGKVVEFVSRFQPKLVNRVKLYTKEQPIFEEFGIQHELDKALRAKVWLKSGGYIVINHTEALVAIDVNTGKFVGKGSIRLEDTIVKTNLEAVKEIVRQIRLRDLGGIIVVDFIDMEERRNREKVLSALQQALEEDKAPSKALSFNEFGLVCITRKRTKQALERVLCQPCPYCTGSGMVKSIPTLCYEISAEARKMAAADRESPNLTLRVNPEIAKALKTRESMLMDELEQTSHKHVIIQSDATLHWEQYDIY